MRVYLRTKFEVSSTILTSFREEGDSLPPPPHSKWTLKSPPRLGLKINLLALSLLLSLCISFLLWNISTTGAYENCNVIKAFKKTCPCRKLSDQIIRKSALSCLTRFLHNDSTWFSKLKWLSIFVPRSYRELPYS